MGIVNRRNAVLGWSVWTVGKRIAKRKAKGFEVRVHPTLIPARRLIANVEGVMNAILVKGDAVGQTTIAHDGPLVGPIGIHRVNETGVQFEDEQTAGVDEAR